MTGKQLFVRTFVTAALPSILIYSLLAELCKGIASAFRHAWIEVRIELEAYRKNMRREDY